jgi:hypothetical protein
MDETHTTLTLDARWALPLLQHDWKISLVKGLPWNISLHAALGKLQLNLRDLTVWALHVDTWGGEVAITLPATGHGEGQAHMGLGDLTLYVPEGLGLRLQAQLGTLATITIDPQRYQPAAAYIWETAGFAEAPHRFTLVVTLGAGALTVV